jgi:hypothetical protein
MPIESNIRWHIFFKTMKKIPNGKQNQRTKAIFTFHTVISFIEFSDYFDYSK